MREIKFRFWDSLKNNLFTSDQCNSYEVWDTIEDNERFKTMQYTGLKDKNGKEIYEGDLLSAVKFGTNIPVSQLWEVYYDNERLTYYWRNNKGIEESFWEFQLGSVEYIVFGNIYEMPDWDF